VNEAVSPRPSTRWWPLPRGSAALFGPRIRGVAWIRQSPHTASVLLSEHINPSKVAERLGHDLKTLLTTYAHVMPQDDDRVRAIVGTDLGASAEDWLRIEAG
jgi:hypothetical protein